MMATFHESGTGYRVTVKGAPEALLKVSTHLASAEGDAVALSEDGRKR